LGRTTVVDRIEITWPGGQRQVLEKVKADQVITVREPR
jgi:hypothetical protein